MYVKFEERVNGVVVQHIISGHHSHVHTWQCQRADLGTVRSGKLRGVWINGKNAIAHILSQKELGWHDQL